MRVLKPETAKNRQDDILRWVVREYMETRRPVGSEHIAQKAGFGLSSATIRSIMKKLEDEGYLYHPHTSGGRIPTDKAYRFYVDYITEMQRLVVDEKENIERQYSQRINEINQLMVQTSRTLAMLSRSAGFVYSCGVCSQCVARMDFVPLGPRHVLVVIVTDSGAVRHWPIELGSEISPDRLRLLTEFVNQTVTGLPLQDAQARLASYIGQVHEELGSVAGFAARAIGDIISASDNSDGFHVEGLSHLIETSEMDEHDFYAMLNVLEERNRISAFLNEKLQDFGRQTPADDLHRIQVSIGSENELQELRNLSIVSASYRIGERPVGLLGIIGPKHMEYSRMISLVNFIGSMMERTITHWEQMMLPSAKPAPAPETEQKTPRRNTRKTKQ